MSGTLQRAHDAFRRRAWADAFAAFNEAATDGELDAAEREVLAVSAHLIGRDDDSARAWESAFRSHLDAGERADAARCAFWLAFSLMMGGHMAQAGGWLGRAEGLVEQLDSVANGYLLVPRVVGALTSGDAKAAAELSDRVTDVGLRFGDADLTAFGMLGRGRALIAAGDSSAGTARLDEVMVTVTSGEVGPITSGIVYCAVIMECMQMLDLHRASEWTEALTRWCDEQPGLVLYRGQCLVHRSQLQQVAGDWSNAASTAAEARDHLTDPPHPALGLAHYQEGELHRLVGDTEAAVAAYRQASRCGHEPMPGLALLDLARGDGDAAVAGITRALNEPAKPAGRATLLAAAVEILRARGDLPAARSAADELSSMAASGGSPALEAVAAQAAGAVSVSEGDAQMALRELRRATAIWAAIPVPYETARTSVLIGLACSMLGDRTSAELQFYNARETFTELGARPDLERLETLRQGLTRAGQSGSGPLSARELEVLTQVAAGLTNRQIASRLTLSPHTVDRHLENIYRKLGVTTRAAATAYAYEHELI